ncbi:hypothetical protein [Candidatus Bodocaedibacter vickermanii]|uniref:Uncharacterized protein n=1 Tax=Candidatus Bodocaedibacter vickermanii TaxID=2741701 RepID=A0A7L9RSC0_9PROT|nr:hypothetical protein CPBP_00269 [Candidatus Paracaedibacteraceae bacterium 'Lake Konstanz']
MKLGFTALAFLAFTSNVSAAEIIPFSNINLNTAKNTVKVKPAHKDCSTAMHAYSEDTFSSLLKNTNIDPKAATSEAALYAIKNHHLFSGGQLYRFANKLSKANERFAANFLLERIVERDTNNSTPDLLIKVAGKLKQNTPILAAKAYLYAQQHSQATEEEKAVAEREYTALKNLALMLSSL